MAQLQPTVSATSSPAHLPPLDGLRGIAILGVLLFHSDWLPGGFLGVDLFFALSGYLITGRMLREVAATGTVSLVSFWGRRIRRLVPALAAVLVVVTVTVGVLAPPEQVRTTVADGPWVQLNLVNWHLLAESASYWDRFGPVRVFEHLWSIAVEEQFYLAWPLVVVLLVGVPALRGGRGERRVAATAALLSLASAILMATLADPADPTRVYTGTDTRAFSLLLGALVATRPVHDALARVVGRRPGVVSAALVAALGAMWAVADGTSSAWLFTGGLVAYSTAAALLLGLCAHAPHTAVARALAWPPLRGLGLVSYSLYLWHWPVFALLPPERGLATTVLAWTVAIGLAVLSKYLVEDPVRFRARWARGRQGMLAFAALMVALAVLWFAFPVPEPPAVDVSELG